MPENCNLRAVAVTETRKLPLMEQFFAVRRFSSVLAFTADGSQLLFASNISGQFNLWRVPVEGGWPDQLTAFTDETVRGVGVSPTRRQRSCSAPITTATSSTSSTCSIRIGGWPEKLTDEPQVQHYVGGAAWAPDGTKFAYAANARKPVRHGGLGSRRRERRDAAGLRRGHVLLPGPTGRPDGTKLLALDFRNNSDTSIHLVDVETGRLARADAARRGRRLTSRGRGRATARASTCSPTQGSEFRGLAFYDLASDRYEWVEEPTQDVDDVTIVRRRPGARLARQRQRLRPAAAARSRDREDLPEPELPGRRAPAPDRRRAAARAVAGRLARGV